MTIVVSTAAIVMAAAAVLALEARSLRLSAIAIAIGGACLAIAACAMRAYEVGALAAIAAPVLYWLVTWASRRTGQTAPRQAWKPHIGAMLGPGLVVFAGLLLALAVVPEVRDGALPSPVAEAAEGLAAVSFLREALVLAALAAAAWAFLRVAHGGGK